MPKTARERIIDLAMESLPIIYEKMGPGCELTLENQVKAARQVSIKLHNDDHQITVLAEDTTLAFRSMKYMDQVKKQHGFTATNWAPASFSIWKLIANGVPCYRLTDEVVEMLHGMADPIGVRFVDLDFPKDSIVFYRKKNEDYLLSSYGLDDSRVVCSLNGKGDLVLIPRRNDAVVSIPDEQMTNFLELDDQDLTETSPDKLLLRLAVLVKYGTENLSIKTQRTKSEVGGKSEAKQAVEHYISLNAIGSKWLQDQQKLLIEHTERARSEASYRVSNWFRKAHFRMQNGTCVAVKASICHRRATEVVTEKSIVIGA